MLVPTLFTATAIFYAIACALYLAYLFKGTQGLERFTSASLGIAVVLHLVFMATDHTVRGTNPVEDIHRTMSVLSLTTVVAFLIASTRYRITVLGAFITPVTLLFFIASGLGSNVATVPDEVRSAVLPIHVGVNILGVGAFALAFAAAVGYVIQERMLRRKQLGGVFQRLPALDELDSFSFRAVLVGFPLLTIGVVTGALWAVRIRPDAPAVTVATAFGLLTWVVFGGVLLLRVAAGWRGRRAALGTIMGFACAVAVLVTYILRAGGPGG